jgi:hypothetical protein
MVRVLRAKAEKYWRMRDGFRDPQAREALKETAESLERQADEIEASRKGPGGESTPSRGSQSSDS